MLVAVHYSLTLLYMVKIEDWGMGYPRSCKLTWSVQKRDSAVVPYVDEAENKAPKSL